ncbi:hypothetical protein FQN54_005783 [Arachnomyces sp. PD_36]|nr:hypothetical protein FQN54_005783 [Arachnomyces sp. PD_36]
MKLAIISLILPLVALAQNTASISYDTVYDNPSLDLLTTSCSDGKNGLVTKGYKVASDLPSFPNIGGALSIPGWNSPNCGKCYGITFEGKTIYVTAVDKAVGGFNLSKKAMNNLTGGRAEALGRVNAQYFPAQRAKCYS